MKGRAESTAAPPTLALDANASRPALPAARDAYKTAAAAMDAETNAHARAAAARATLTAARADIAQAMSVDADEIVFTSGGTEAAAWAVAGAMHAQPDGRVVTSALEHPAVARTAAMVAENPGYAWHPVACPRSGRMDPAHIVAACATGADGAATRLVSLIAASNETGTLQPVPEVAAWCRTRGILCHTDAVQAVGRSAVDLRAWQVDLASWAGHKVGAVGAIGCLYVRRGVTLCPPWLPWRAGAPVQDLEDPEISPAAAAALAAALRARAPQTEQVLQARRDRFEAALAARIPDLEVFGQSVPRLGHVTCVRFAGCDGDGLMMALDLDGFFCSTGSACASGSIEPSPVLLGMGCTPQEAREALRFSFDDSVTDAGLARLIERLVTLVARMRR